MPSLNEMIHEVCEDGRISQTQYFSLRPGSFELYLGMDETGYTYHLFTCSKRPNRSVEATSRLYKESHLIDSCYSPVLETFAARLIGILELEIARHNRNCDARIWLREQLEGYLSERRGLVGRLSAYWKKRRK